MRSAESDDNNNDHNHDQIRQRLQHMRTSLSELESTLQSIDLELPDKLESLQESIGTIQHYITKKENESNEGGTSSLSRTERAILSRVDTNIRTKSSNKEDINEDMENVAIITSKLAEMDAEQRFAMFVSHVDPW